jgi:hypothetical protein
MALIEKKYFVNRPGMRPFLNDIEKSPVPTTVSVYLPPGLSLPDIEELVASGGIRPAPADLAQLVSGSKTGAAIFWGSQRRCLVLPPFQVLEKAIFAGYAGGPLLRLLDSDFSIGMVLVHLGSYAVGLCHGDSLVSSKVGTGLVHGRNKKGGSSQGRFQRRRQNQASEFLDRVCLHAREHLEPQAKQLDYILYGGPRQTVLQLKKQCRFLQSLRDRELPLMDVPELRQPVLEKAVGRLWSSTVIEWSEE